MRKMERIAFACMLCFTSTALVLRFTAPSTAQSDDAQVKNLLQDIAAYYSRCKGAEPSPSTPVSLSCANEKAELLRRQHNLHVTDAEVNAQLSGRGGFGRWP